MVSLDICRKAALSFPEVNEQPHFNKTSFRVARRIFATLNESNFQLIVKFSLVDQDVFAKFAPHHIYPVANKWGKQGWTTCCLNYLNEDILMNVLTAAYIEVAPDRLAILLKSNDD
jgi:predicted DNA-binding protein (MmcQ/YjbR family)